MTIEQFLRKAKELSASDIHVAAGAECRYRVHGEIREAGDPPLSREEVNGLIAEVMPKKVARELAGRGEATFAYEAPELGRYRVHVFRQQGSYGMVIHVVHTEVPSPKELGIPDGVMELARRRRGLVLVTGPTGTGKSTTLAVLLDWINRSCHCGIVTLESPIEYVHAHRQSLVSQREIGTDTVSYSSGLRAAMLEDADVIMGGELEDAETISDALRAAESGHLVLATMHTIGAVPTIERLLDAFPAERRQQTRLWLSGVLEAVVSQQLIPSLDGDGLALACEVMSVTPSIKNLIREGKDHQIGPAIQAARKYGMQTMDDAIYELYSERKISGEMAVEFATDPIAMERRI